MKTLCPFVGITDINEKSTENKHYFSTTIKLFEVEDWNRFSYWKYKVVPYENTFLYENNIWKVSISISLIWFPVRAKRKLIKRKKEKRKNEMIYDSKSG
jgi:hypothetical protein